MKKRLVAFLLAAVMLFLLAACDDTSIENNVYISEIMSNNVTTLADENGDMCDWIELHNPTDEPVNIGGYMLTDNSENMNKYTFPSITLQPDEYFVIFADGVDKYDAANRIVHVPFSISTKGESIFLYNAKGKLICRVNVVGLEDDQSYGVGKEQKLVIFDIPTPGEANSDSIYEVEAENADKPVVNMSGKIYINEYAPNSTQTIMDEDGDFVSWVELYNDTDSDVNLKSYSLSDDALDIDKWVFPDFTIKAKGYALVYLSGKTKEYDGSERIHATFKLNGKEDSLILYDNADTAIDICTVDELMSNLSCGRSLEDKSKFVYFAKPTPGKENVSAGFDTIGSARYTKNKEVVITEVAPVNTTVPQSTLDEYFDYVELYNPGSEAINLQNYKLSDSKKTESFHQLPDRTLEPGEYVAIFCGDSSYVSKKTGNIYVDYGLNRYGETIYVMDNDGVLVDEFSYSRMKSGYSSGRDVNGTLDEVCFELLTPGEANPVSTLKKTLATPELSMSSTYVDAGTKVEITAAKGEIRYTLDGSEPQKSSPLYSGPITVNETTVIRAAAFSEGYIPSDVVCGTYLVTDRVHDLDVVFLTTDEANLYDYHTGIWADGPNIGSEFPYVGANYWEEWERPVNFEFMTSDGVSQLSFDAGIKVFGQYSRANAQKSVSINLRDKYGPTEICYPFFEDNDVNVFSSFLLRNSGQDYNIAHIRDAFCAMVIKNQMDIDIMDYKPVVCYVNGKYHGIYDLREKIDEDYLANHHGIDPDNVDVIKGNSIVKNGSMDNYTALCEYIKTHDMRVDEYYDYVCSQIDIDELINYWMCEGFFTNTDTGNIKFWRENTEGAKWRWIFFDVDWALFGSTYTSNIFDNYMDPVGHGVGRSFRTTITSNIIKNPKFRQRMMEIIGQHLKTTFDTDRMLGILDELVAEIDSEMPYHYDRWKVHTYEKWLLRVQTVRDIVSEKNEIFRNHVIDALDMTQEEIDTYFN